MLPKNNEQSAVADFLGEFDNKGEQKDPFKDIQADPFVAPEQATEEVVEPKDEKPLPFNKDPKIQKFIEKEISKRLADFKPEPAREATQPQADTRMDEVLNRIIGNDTPEKVQGVRDMKDLLMGLTGKAKAEALAELESRQNQALEADREAERELETAFDNIEESYDVDLTSRNPLAVKLRQEFVSYVERIAPKDRNGDIRDYPDMNAAWEDFSERRKLTAQPNRAKELASRSMARSSEVNNATAIPANKHSFERSDNFLESLSK